MILAPGTDSVRMFMTLAFSDGKLKKESGRKWFLRLGKQTNE